MSPPALSVSPVATPTWIAERLREAGRLAQGDVIEVVPKDTGAFNSNTLRLEVMYSPETPSDDGRTLRRIDAWHDGAFLPTGVAPEPRGVWIADGYGSNRVDLVAPDDEVLVTIERLDCPHGVRIDTRGGEPRLVIAERGAHRIAVHDLDGAFVRHDGVVELMAPCAMAIAGDLLYVADLVARVTVLDADGALVAHIGADADAPKRKGWPNARDDAGRPVPPESVDGRFNSPHGIAVTGNDVVVAEWLLGGRWVRAARQ